MITGGCLCGKIRYEAEIELFLAIRCHCRDCQYVSGGEPAAVISIARGALCAFKANRAYTGRRPILVLLFSGRSVRTAVRLCSLATRKTPNGFLSSSVRSTSHPGSRQPVTYGHRRRSLGITSR